MDEKLQHSQSLKLGNDESKSKGKQGKRRGLRIPLKGLKRRKWRANRNKSQRQLKADKNRPQRRLKVKCGGHQNGNQEIFRAPMDKHHQPIWETEVAMFQWPPKICMDKTKPRTLQGVDTSEGNCGKHAREGGTKRRKPMSHPLAPEENNSHDLDKGCLCMSHMEHAPWCAEKRLFALNNRLSNHVAVVILFDTPTSRKLRTHDTTRPVRGCHSVKLLQSPMLNTFIVGCALFIWFLCGPAPLKWKLSLSLDPKILKTWNTMKTKPIIDRDKWKQPRIQWSNGRTLPRTARVDASGEKMPQHQSVAEKVVGKESKETHANEEVLSETWKKTCKTRWIQSNQGDKWKRRTLDTTPGTRGDTVAVWVGNQKGLSRQPKAPSREPWVGN